MKFHKIHLLLCLVFLLLPMILTSCQDSNPSEQPNKPPLDNVTSPDDTSPPPSEQKHSHAFGEWNVTTPATCTTEGAEMRACACGETQTDIHSYQNDSCPICKEENPYDYYYIDGDDDTIACAIEQGIDGRMNKIMSIPSSINDHSVIAIGEGAFEKNTTITEMILPDILKTIGEFAFKGCSALTKIEIPEGVTTIESGAFYDCQSFTTVTISKSVAVIDYNAFSKCSKLTEIVYKGTIKEWEALEYSDSAF